MVIATGYPFLDILWTMLIFFAWIVWIWMVVVIFTDVFRRHDINGWQKAAWCVFMIVLPFIGVLTYLISQHDKMAERGAQQSARMQHEVDTHIREVAGPANGAATEIEKAAHLRDAGTITETEFGQIKARALAAH